MAPGVGAMAALLCLDFDAAAAVAQEAAQGEICQAANDNGGGQVVISGAKAAIERSLEIAKAHGARRAVLLPVSAPFHCSLMKRAEENMRPLLEATRVSSPACPYLANVDAEPHADMAGIVDRLVRQICGSVKWEQSMQKLPGLGVTEGIEVGPGRVLFGLMRRIQKEIKVLGMDTAEDLKKLG